MQFTDLEADWAASEALILDAYSQHKREFWHHLRIFIHRRWPDLDPVGLPLIRRDRIYAFLLAAYCVALRQQRERLAEGKTKSVLRKITTRKNAQNI